MSVFCGVNGVVLVKWFNCMSCLLVSACDCGSVSVVESSAWSESSGVRVVMSGVCGVFV